VDIISTLAAVEGEVIRQNLTEIEISLNRHKTEGSKTAVAKGEVTASIQRKNTKCI
jgi:hypothetical protein